MTEENNHCLNCSTPLAGEYCHACGQRHVDASRRDLKHLLGEWWAAISMWDSRLLASLRRLLFRPGHLTAVYLAGQRVRYLSPISLFLLANLLYFLAPPLTDFSLTLYEQYHWQIYSGFAQSLIDARLAENGMTFTEYAAVYDQQTRELARALAIVNVPIFALLLRATFAQHKLLLADHFVFALHFYAVLLITVVAVSSFGTLLLFVTSTQTGWNLDSGAVSATTASIALLLILLWAAVAWRHTYRTAWTTALLATPLVLAFYIVANQFARIVLLLATLAAT